MLIDPDGRAVENAIRQTAERVKRERELGNKTTFVFYYSGHARSTTLNLGTDEVSIGTVRELIDAVPADFKWVVLDACRTGAYSNVKGIAPATDFSYNSVAGLNQEGTAVMASATSNELVQESARLRGSFFTHHLVAALRGAADADGDGLVTLEEAYRYAHDRTLVDTSKTAVGKQHITLETDLRGKGETVLSRVGATTARLRIPKGTPLDALIYRASDRRVMAEVHSAAEQGMLPALPPVAYGITARLGDEVRECHVTLRDGKTETVDTKACTRIKTEPLDTKGQALRKDTRYLFEAAFGVQWGHQDAFVSRLHDFGFSSDKEHDPQLHMTLTGYFRPIRYLGIGIQYALLDRGEYTVLEEKFSWFAERLGVTCRGLPPPAEGRIAFFAEVGVGVAFAKTVYTNNEPLIKMADTSAGRIDDEERFVRYFVTGGGGILWSPWPYAGFVLQGAYSYAPVIDNLLGDTHDSGGPTVTVGFFGGY